MFIVTLHAQRLPPVPEDCAAGDCCEGTVWDAVQARAWRMERRRVPAWRTLTTTEPLVFPTSSFCSDLSEKSANEASCRSCHQTQEHQQIGRGAKAVPIEVKCG